MIAKIIRDLRAKQNMNARILARKVGKNHAYISQIETGRIKHPHLPTLKKILAILGCTENEINEIILNEFTDVEEKSKSHSPNKIDYRLERKFILSGKELKDYGKEEKIKLNYLKEEILTKQQYLDKCEFDAINLYAELKQLPKETLDLLIHMLYDDI
jgi:transcriptional regulator with XRE-family HTH domain